MTVATTEKIMVEGVLFPSEIFISKSKALSLVAQGFRDQPKKTVIGVYLVPSEVKPHFENWERENEDAVSGRGNLYDALMPAEMDKVIRVVVTEGRYDLYGVALETEVKEILEDCTEAEQTEIDKIVQFIRSKHIKAITYHFPGTNDTSSKIGIEIEGKEDEEYLRMENVIVVGALKDFCLKGIYRLSPSFDESPPIMVEGVSFPSLIFFPPDAFFLVAQGSDNLPTNTAIGLYLDSVSVQSVFVNWKRETKQVLSEDDNIFDALLSAEMDKVIRMVVMHGVEGGQYAEHLKKQMSGLTALGETEVLDSVVSFFKSKDLKTNSIITYYFSHQNRTCEIKIEIEGKEEGKLTVENVRLVGELNSFSFSGINRLLPDFDD